MRAHFMPMKPGLRDDDIYFVICQKRHKAFSACAEDNVIAATMQAMRSLIKLAGGWMILKNTCDRCHYAPL